MKAAFPILSFLRYALCAALVAVFALATASKVAWSHATLLESRPADGASVAIAPAAVVLRFNEPVTLIRLQIIDGTGRAIRLPAAPTAIDGEIRVPLPSGLPPGRYLVSYRMTSADAHPVGGAFLFSIGSSSVLDLRAPAVEQQSVGAPITRALHYFSLLVAVGIVLFIFLVTKDEEGSIRRSIRASVAVAVVTAVVGIGLQGALLLNAPVEDLLGLDTWRSGITSTAGTSAVVAVAGLILLAIGTGLKARQQAAALTLGGGTIAILSIGLTGHAASAPPTWLAAPAVVVHGLAAAFWLGSLVALLHVLSGRTTTAAVATVVARFSRLAIWAVIALVSAGMLIAAIQVRDPVALWSTDYGQLLLLKVALVAALLSVATYNRLHLAPALDSGNEWARRNLIRTVQAEIVLAVAIVSATAVLGTVPPPRAQHIGQANAATSIAVMAGGRLATIAVETEQGQRTLSVRLASSAGTPIAAKEVVARIEVPAAGIEPIARNLQPRSAGVYAYKGIEMPLIGSWRITIEALIDEFEKATFAADLTVR